MTRCIIAIGLLTMFSAAPTAHGQSLGQLFNQARALEKQGDYVQAAAIYERILPPTEQQYGKNGPNTALVVNSLAVLYVELGQYAKAEPFFQRFLQIKETIHGKDDPNVAPALNNLANLYRALGEHEKAEPLHVRGLKLREGSLGKDHPDVGSSLANLGNLYADMGQFAKAESYFLRSLRLREEKLGKDHVDVANSLAGLANLYRDQGQFTKGEAAMRRALQILEAKNGADHPEICRSLDGLASIYMAMGQNDKAEALFQRGLRIREAKLGKNHPDVASSLNNLGGMLVESGQYAKAEPLYERSLNIRETELGKDHPRVATALNNLALLLVRKKEYARAEPLYTRSLQILEAKLGSDHPDVAGTLIGLGSLYRDQGQHAKATSLIERSLRIRTAQLGKDHPDIANSLNTLGGNYGLQKDWAKAIEQFQSARRITATYLAEALPALTEEEQLQFLEARFVRDYDAALSLGWSAPQAAARASAEWLLNGKAIVHQTLAEQTLLTRDAATPETRQLTTDLQSVRSLLAAHVNRTPTAGREQIYQKSLNDLKAREQDLAQKLARLAGRAARADTWMTLDELQAKLGAKTAFVDIARFELFDYEKRKQLTHRYAAWITPPKRQGEVQVIDLGDAAPIDALIDETRKALIASAKSIATVGEAQAFAVLQKPLTALSEKVLHPLLPALSRYEDWIVCPDGALWLVPWNALLMPKGGYVLEKHLIRHAVSGRDLVLEGAKINGKSAYLIADPDYDLTPGKVHIGTGLRGIGSPLLGQRLRGVIGTWNVSFEFLDKEVVIYDEDAGGAVAGKGTWKHEGDALTIQTELSQFDGKFAAGEIRGQRGKLTPDGSPRDAFRIALADETRAVVSRTLPRVARLPGTALEAETIQPKIEKWLGEEPKMFLQEKAGETLVKSLMSPRVLVLATHGYFLPNQEIPKQSRADAGETKRSAPLTDTSGQRVENPLLRCGLLLAGCNKRAEAKPGEDDGILTGLEIVGMDLRGTELVVLSACETGLGDVRSGEGVAGLRQAFQMAGAKGVLASLWQVPDRETALLMNAFYGELTKGKGQAAALREAQLSRIAARQATFGAAHPFFWAAFTLTSRGAE